uniref:Uncharacterized protein n=1 Tax=Oryza barthii TaxID=65489 RepID=A0A0D3FFB8_9ORYZ
MEDVAATAPCSGSTAPPLPLSLSLTALATELLAVAASLAATAAGSGEQWAMATGRAAVPCDLGEESEVGGEDLDDFGERSEVGGGDPVSTGCRGAVISVLIDEKKKDVETDRAHINRRTGRLVGPCMPVQVLDGSMNS